jgi:hypothetical protein
VYETRCPWERENNFVRMDFLETVLEDILNQAFENPGVFHVLEFND